MAAVLDAFRVYNKEQRPLVRCIHVPGTSDTRKSDRVRYLKSCRSTAEPKYHFIFAQETSDIQAVSSVLSPQGLVCFGSISQEASEQLNQFFEPICEVSDLGSEPWQLWRRKSAGPVAKYGSKRFLFGTLPSEVEPNAIGPFSELIPLEPSAVEDFCRNGQKARFHAVVRDIPEKSVITTWSGNDLLPWLRTILKYADSILWITTNNISGPFQKMAGTLLRTLQAEQPSLKVCCFVRDGGSGKPFQRDFHAAQSSMLEDQNEIMHDFETEDASHVLRYHSDDELFFVTGLMEPRRVIGSLDQTDYELSFAAPGEPMVLSKPTKPSQSFGKGSVNVEAKPLATGVRPDHEDLVEVEVEASVIDPGDIKIYDECIDHDTKSMQSKFIAKIVRIKISREYNLGIRLSTGPTKHIKVDCKYHLVVCSCV